MAKLHLFVVLSLMSVAASALSIYDDQVGHFEKRTDDVYVCPEIARNVLSKRNNVEQCQTTIAEAIFQDVFEGFFFFAQDECGSTTIVGMFSHGFEIFNNDTSDVKFQILDSCNRTIYDLTDELNVQINNDGSTDPFSYTFEEINLDCYDDGILFPTDSLSKRNCEGNQRRAPHGKHVGITKNNKEYGGASIKRMKKRH
ncbi:3717_t:CDS:1 [Funneliformis geosporum]|uniref:3331_t:CDS:1 n=1 Tax=Funneliformis geosporum TaxID=1117311 RepID=A0A9W4WUI0_9GLOM|nr:3331_t:CDS:1 [Funneliformis geosporum]CAI2171867.1 3717_t:CDS:1 [Funneliformis geosporum]